MRDLLPFVIALHEEEEDEKKTWRRIISDFVKDDLKTIEKRRRTFINWPLKNISPDQLARDGLFYTRDGVKCKCLFCSNVFDEWEKLGRSGTKRKHYEISPQCQKLLDKNKAMEFETPPNDFHRHPFFDFDTCGFKIVQIFFKNYCKQEAILINNSNDEDYPQYSFNEFEKSGIFLHTDCEAPKYASKSERFKSFRNWPEASTVRQSPDEFAEAGFIFMEVGDNVTCFSCGIVIGNFENEDDLWIEHAKHSPFCRYLLYKKKYEFVKSVHSQYRMDEKTGIFHKCAKEEVEKNKKKVEERFPSTEKSTLLNSSLSEKAFSESLETESVKNICKICLINPIEAVFLPCKHMATCCSACVNKNRLFCPVCGEKIITVFKTSNYEEEKEKGESIYQEQKENEEGKKKSTLLNSSLTEKAFSESLKTESVTNICKICLINPIEAVFLPCKHMVTCCSSCLNKNRLFCPVCGEKIIIAFETSNNEEKKEKDESIYQEQKENKEGKRKCFKCSIEPPEVIFLPCTHMILCASCSLLSKNCPLCEEKAEYCFKPIIR